MSNTAPFLHIAYANNDTGTLDFTTTGGIERTYTGFYTDEYATDSNDPTKYKWRTNAEFKNKVSTAAYAKSADGKDDFTTVYPNVNLLNGTKIPKTIPGFNVPNQGALLYPFDNGENLANQGFNVNDALTLEFDWSATNPVSGYFILQWQGVPWGFSLPTINISSTNSSGHVVYTFNVRDKDIAPTAYATGIGYRLDYVPNNTAITFENVIIRKAKGSQPWMPSITEVKDSDYPQYIGLSNVTNPTTFKDYEWTLLESIPKKILNTHVAYANSWDGVTDFTTTYPNLNLLDGTSDKKSNGTIGVNNSHLNSLHSAISVTAGEKFVYQALFTSDNTTDLAVGIDLYSGVTWKTYYAGNFIKAGNTGRSIVAFQIPEGVDRIIVNIGLLTFIPTEPIIVYWQEEKLEHGSVATPYMPSASEVQPSDYPKFVGVYGDDSTTASQLPAVYKWSSIPAPSPTPPTVMDNLYILTMPTVKSINLTYGIGTLTTKPVTWLSAKPKLDVNQVLWYKSEITGIDNSVGVYYSNLVGGANLDDGDSPLDNTVVSIVLNNKTVNVPRDLALKLELLSQTLNKRDDSLAQLIADTNDRITNIDMGSGQAGLNQEVIDRKNADDALGGRIDTVTGNVNDLTTTTQTKFTNIEKQLGGFSVQGTKNSSLTRPSIVFNYNAYGTTLPDGTTDGGGRLYYQVPGDTTYDVKELKFNYQAIPSFYDMDQVTIWEKSWSALYGGFNWRDTIITTTDTDVFYIDGMTTYYDHNGDLIIRGKVVMDGIDDWIGSMTNRGFKPDTVAITVASGLKSVKSIRFTGDIGVIEMSIGLGFSAVAQVQRIGRRVSFYGSSPVGTFSTTGTSWTSLTEKIPYGLRPTRSFEFAATVSGNNNSIQYSFDKNSSMKVRQSASTANQAQIMGQVTWQTFDQYPPSNYASNSTWTNR